MAYPDTITVTVDKSHITVLGEKLYAESIELLRELVNNAFDADATEVRVEVSAERIAVADDGTGMDYDGLVQYFNIGSPGKRVQNRSPRFHRIRIGQFGIGKFSSLTIARRFEVLTRRGSFAARVVFDKEAWEANRDVWSLPLEILDASTREGDGTTVLLSGLTRSFDPAEVEQRLITGTPLRAEHFRVLLNGHPVSPRSLTGARLPILEGTPFGPIHGEIVIVPASASDAVVKRMRFGKRAVTCIIDHFGVEGPEVFSEENAIYLNADHPLFERESGNPRAFTMFVARLFAQEIALMQNPRNPRKAFEMQSRILREAFRE